MIEVLFLAPRKYSKTTKLIYDATRSLGLNVVLATLEDIVIGLGEEEYLYYGNLDISSPSFVFPRIDAKRKDIGLKVLTYYELRDIPKTYRAYNLNIVHDKFLTSMYLSSYGINVPRTIYAKSSDSIDINALEFPVIVKLLSGSGGKGVMFIESEEALTELLSTLNDAENQEILIQEYIRGEENADLRLFVVGSGVVGAMKRVAPKGDVRSNVKVGGSALPYNPSDEEIEIALKACKSLGIDVCGVDMMKDKEGNIYVVELNLSPGIRGLMEATGKDIAKEIAHYIKERVRK